jgi:hypothetical protein
LHRHKFIWKFSRRQNGDGGNTTISFRETYFKEIKMSFEHKELCRRKFLANSGKAAVGLVAAGTLASCTSPQTAPAAKSRVLGANERVNVAVIGIRSRGLKLAGSFAEQSDVRIKTLVDVDENLFAERVKKIEEIQAARPTTAYDLRRTLDDKDIDVVVIATTDHWHALATIWACQAGKHVYVEKPCCHNIWEGRKMVEAARKYNRIVTVGMQSRSMQSARKAMKFLHEGGIGDVYMARGLAGSPMVRCLRAAAKLISDSERCRPLQPTI